MKMDKLVMGISRIESVIYKQVERPTRESIEATVKKILIELAKVELLISLLLRGMVLR